MEKARKKRTVKKTPKKALPEINDDLDLGEDTTNDVDLGQREYGEGIRAVNPIIIKEEDEATFVSTYVNDEDKEEDTLHIEVGRNRDPDAPVKWKKLGGGTFLLKETGKDGKIHSRRIKPNQIFDARPSQIPQAFRRNIVPLDQAPPPTIVTVSTMYEIRPSLEEGMHDVVHVVSNKPINTKPLLMDEAKSLLDVLG